MQIQQFSGFWDFGFVNPGILGLGFWGFGVQGLDFTSNYELGLLSGQATFSKMTPPGISKTITSQTSPLGAQQVENHLLLILESGQQVFNSNESQL